MSFATFVTPKDSFRKTSYLKITAGLPVTIQLMDDHSTEIGKHWVTDGAGRKVGLICPGKDICPICARNAEVGYNREHPNFVSLQRRHRVNVLDLTPVIRCPNCEALYHVNAVPVVCSNEGCGTQLAGIAPTPLKEVKILERGRRLMEQFNGLEDVPHPVTGKKEKLQDYPIMLVATGAGTDMVIAAIPQSMQEVSLAEYEKYDLTQGLMLDADEIRFLLAGGTLRDVLTARKAEAAVVEQVAVEAPASIPF